MGSKKQNRKTRSHSRHTRSSNPLDTIFDDAMGIVTGHALRKMSNNVAKIFGLGGMSAEDKVRFDRSQLSLKRTEVDLARQKRREADARERAAMLWQKHQKQLAIDEKRARLVDIQIEERELALERSRENQNRLLNQRTEIDLRIVTEPISGALEVTANPSGLTGPQVQQEAYKVWLDSFESGKIVLILGKRGSGKSALAAKIAEYIMAVHKMPTYWIGLPEKARELLPSWIKLIDTPDKCPVNSLILTDEAAINYLSLLFNTPQSRLMRRMLMLCRQRHSSLIFATQSSRDVDWSIVRQSDTIIFRQLGLGQPDSERPEVKAKAKKAALAFQEIPKDERIEMAFVYDHDFIGMIRSSLPSFWTEQLSHIYAHLDLTEIENRGRAKEEPRQLTTGDTPTIDTASLNQAIRELEQQGYGQKRIAKTLGCTEWRVRKCLNG